MMENSGRGALIDLSTIPCPAPLTLPQWLLSFQSFGFILSAKPEFSARVIELFKEKGIEAAVVGKVLDGRTVTLTNGSKQLVLFNFDRDRITGISRETAEDEESC